MMHLSLFSTLLTRTSGTPTCWCPLFRLQLHLLVDEDDEELRSSESLSYEELSEVEVKVKDPEYPEEPLESPPWPWFKHFNANPM